MNKVTKKAKALAVINKYYTFFNKIPKTKWCTENFTRGDKHCAEGWLRSDYGKEVFGKEISKTSLTLQNIVYAAGAGATVHLNDGRGEFTKFGADPKTRILTAINKVKKHILNKKKIPAL
jgi:hypothetical protein